MAAIFSIARYYIYDECKGYFQQAVCSYLQKFTSKISHYETLFM
jgi:hypothetical protein